MIRQRPSAFVALIFLTLIYASLPFVELIAPYDPSTRSNDALFAPPQAMHLFHDGSFVGPYVYGYTSTVDLETYQRKFTLDETVYRQNYLRLPAKIVEAPVRTPRPAKVA